MNQTTYTARWIFPVDAPPLERGTITIQADKIVAVEPHGMRTADTDLGNVALLPGFVNAHTHLDLSGARGQCPPEADFTLWLRRVIAFRRSRTPEQVQADIAVGIAECLRFGTTLIGDISSGGASWPLLAHAECRATVFYEVLGLSPERARQSWQAAVETPWRTPASDRLRPGVSPHAPYSVHESLFRSCAQWQVATHLAETKAELELLRSRSGPFVDFLKELNVWDPSGLVANPLDVVRLFPHGLFVHGNYLDPATPFLPTQTLVICPRTHAAFGHPHHPFPSMKVRIALGTDSLASNPDLDILAEARFLRQHYPEVEPAALLRMLTLNGAEALGFGDVAGSLKPGKSADLVVLPLPKEERSDPHDFVLTSTLLVRGVMFRGRWIVQL
jgi:cytosine/adenosine deaminase-related metal-dependent hydrolase